MNIKNLKVLSNLDFSEKIIFILLTSIPVFLITGPFIPDLIVTICSIFFLFKVIKYKKIKYFNNKFFYYYLLFYFILIVCSLNSDNIILSLKTSIFYIRFGLFSLCIWYILDKNSNLIFTIFTTILICVITLIIDGYFQFAFQKNLIGMPLINSRVSSFFGDELILGSYLVRLYPLLIGLFIILGFSKKKFFNLLSFLIFILIDALVLISGGRSALVLLNLFALYIIFLMTGNFKKNRIITFIISFLIMSTILVYSPSVKERVVDSTIEQLTQENKKSNFTFSTEHEELYKTAFKMFKQNKITGIGPGMFKRQCNNERYYSNKFSCSTHPHNTYIQLLAETGFLGFLLVFTILVTIIIKSFHHFFCIIFQKRSILSNFNISLYSCFLITLWPFTPTGNFFNNWLNVIFYFPIGFYLWHETKKKDSLKKIND